MSSKSYSVPPHGSICITVKGKQVTPLGQQKKGHSHGTSSKALVTTSFLLLLVRHLLLVTSSDALVTSSMFCLQRNHVD